MARKDAQAVATCIIETAPQASFTFATILSDLSCDGMADKLVAAGRSLHIFGIRSQNQFATSQYS